MISLNRILVPTDFSKSSGKAVNYGVELSAKFGATLHLFHAFEVVPIMYGEGGGEAPQTAVDIQAHAVKSLDALELTGADDVEVVRSVAEGRAFVEIVRYAKTQNIDLIVLGTHGRGVVSQLLIGSVAENVVRKAPCPVLVVRDDEHDFVMP